jgi:hypothetical protein
MHAPRLFPSEMLLQLQLFSLLNPKDLEYKADLLRISLLGLLSVETRLVR